MAENGKLNLLDEELDEESQKYIQESLENWKESMTNQLVSQMKEVEQAKIEELEKENLAYREALKEEFTEKMLDALNELKESIRAEVTAGVIKNNPELKLFEQIKEIVAPTLSEGYRDSTYEDTIIKLSNELEELKRKDEINEGAKVLAELLAPYSEKTQKLVVSLINEGSPEEVTEQFYNIFESLSNVFEADEKAEDEDDSDEDEDSEDEDEKSEDDEDSNEDEDSENEDDEDVKESYDDDSYIVEGYEGNDFEEEKVENPNSTKNIMKKYANL